MTERKLLVLNKTQTHLVAVNIPKSELALALQDTNINLNNISIVDVVNPNTQPSDFEQADLVILPPNFHVSFPKLAAKITQKPHLFWPADFDPKNAAILGTLIHEKVRYSKLGQRLTAKDEQFNLLQKATTNGVWTWDLTNNSAHYSDRWAILLGLNHKILSGLRTDWLDRIHPDDLPLLTEKIANIESGKDNILNFEHRLMHEDGIYRWMICSGVVSISKKQLVGVLSDVTVHKIAQQRLLQNAFYDELTGLANRTLFMDRLGQAIRRSGRDASFIFAVLFLDMDRLKMVNDSLGHMRGDQLLIGIARRLAECLRSGDTLARHGGDEFTILLEGVHDEAGALRVADRIRGSFEEPFNLGGHKVYSSASIGLALSRPDNTEPADIIRDADIAMYRAKEQGRNRCVIFDERMRDEATARLQLEIDLRQAVDQKSFYVVYQPVIRLETGEITGFEALVRWRHPERGQMYPDQFIPVAEETGHIIELDRIVIEKACKQLVEWNSGRPAEKQVYINVNLSSKQFSQPDLVSFFRHIIRTTGIKPSHLNVEITESVFLEYSDSVSDTLNELREIGLGIAIDDFGTGYSSLGTLHQLPVDMLKIDRSFLLAMEEEGRQSEIVFTVVTLGHIMDLRIVAEGVETPQQLRKLRGMQCELAQGYFFAKPLLPDDAIALLNEEKKW